MPYVQYVTMQVEIHGSSLRKILNEQLYSLAPFENDSYELICVFFLHGVTADDTFDDARNLDISADQ